MNRALRAWSREWVPPAVIRYLRRSSAVGITFQDGYDTWKEAREASRGYNDASILEKVKEATLRVSRGEAVYERDSVLFSSVQYSWPLLAGLMWTAAQHGGRVSVLDFGGSLGSSYFQNRQFLDALQDVRWGVVEQPHYVSTGRVEIANERLRFFNTIEECAAAISPNVVLFSSVLHYLEDYKPIVAAAALTKPTMIIVDRTIISVTAKPGLYVQHVPPVIYAATYPCRSLAKGELVARISEQGYELASGFESLPFAALEAIGCSYQGFIFRRVGTP